MGIASGEGHRRCVAEEACGHLHVHVAVDLAEQQDQDCELRWDLAAGLSDEECAAESPRVSAHRYVRQAGARGDA